MKKILLVSLILTSMSTFLTGCWDIKEIQNMVYLNALGIDFVDGEYVVHVQASDFSSIARSEAGKPTQEAQVWVGKGKGGTIDEAFFDLYSTSQLRIYWGHITSLVLSEAIFSNGIQTVFDMLERYNEIRSNIWVYSTKDSIEEIMNATSMFNLGAIYNILHEPKETYNQNSKIPPMYLFRLMSDFSERGKATLIPTLILIKNQWSVSGKQHTLLAVDGAVVVQRGVYKGWIKLINLKGLRWMREETVRSDLSVIRGEKKIAELVLENPKINVKPMIKHGKPQFEIEIKLKAIVNEMTISAKEKEIQKLAEQRVKEEILHTYKEGLSIGADVLQLGYHLYRKDPKGWYKAYGKNEHHFPLDEDSISNLKITVKLISTGKLKLRDGFNPHKR